MLAHLCIHHPRRKYNAYYAYACIFSTQSRTYTDTEEHNHAHEDNFHDAHRSQRRDSPDGVRGSNNDHELWKHTSSNRIERNILRRLLDCNGASTGYAPAEYMDADGQTPIGYDIDINKALAQVMGLNAGETKHSEFPTIIPALGTKFDVGISSFTITTEREQQVNMVSYLNVGSAWGVATGNPKNFNPSDPCGATIAVQTGTAQEEYAATLSDECVAAGKGKITVMPHELQTDIATKLIGGQYDATLADSTVIGYTSTQSGGKIKQIGETFESAPQGIAIAKDDAQLTEAVQKAMQYLMDNGYLTDILATYGADNAALTTAELNPSVN